ncbi:hypothetical protein F443_10406 [Phytophthora nicotianae P1569]|uniref:Uncharacterized protein n=1 Tax=Phytophthora nicotianae P1569 TaxID=1317065 RepID=V9F3Q2_PHYNI|nr:hypothetical protein F443_10406 [Phytophthora nicotianae P1569]
MRWSKLRADGQAADSSASSTACGAASCRVATSTYRSQPIRNTDLGESSNHITRFHHVYEGPRTFNNVTENTRFAKL